MVLQEAQVNGSFKRIISLDKTPWKMLLSVSKADIFLTSFTLRKKRKIKTTTGKLGYPDLHPRPQRMPGFQSLAFCREKQGGWWHWQWKNKQEESFQVWGFLFFLKIQGWTAQIQWVGAASLKKKYFVLHSIAIQILIWPLIPTAGPTNPTAASGESSWKWKDALSCSIADHLSWLKSYMADRPKSKGKTQPQAMCDPG